MQTTIFGYKDIFKALETERPLWIPELVLKLAQSLACLPDKSWAKEQLDYSLNAWLKQRQVPYFSLDDDNTIKLWDLQTGELLQTHGQTLVSGSRDNTIKLWHLNTGKHLRTLTGHNKWVYSLAVMPDGHTLASGSEDKTIKIWQAV